MQAGTYRDPADDYEAAAEFVARRYGQPIDAGLVRALLSVPDHVLEAIESEPQEWSRRVHEYARAAKDHQ
jgi:hypothetical protein